MTGPPLSVVNEADAMLRPDWCVESGLHDKLGESPVWSAQENAIYWVDFYGPAIRRKSLATNHVESWAVPGVTSIGSIVLTQHGLLAATDQGLFNFDPDTGQATFVSDPNQKRPGIGYNDAKRGRDGWYWVSTYDTAETEPRGVLYCLSPQMEAQVADSGYVVCNGPAFSVDGAILYFSDTIGRRIVAYNIDPETRTLHRRRNFYMIPPDEGHPDGITVDAEDCVWVAHYGAGLLSRISPQGNRLARYSVGTTNVTSLCFGGAGLDKMFVTTGENSTVTRQSDHLAGHLLSFKPGVAGVAEPQLMSTHANVC